MELQLKDVRNTPVTLFLEAVDSLEVITFVAIDDEETYINVGLNVEQLKALQQFCNRRLANLTDNTPTLITWKE